MLSSENLIKYANKLLRFRDPFLNKLKIYKEVLLKNCIIPRYNSNSINNLNLYTLETIVTLIFNVSIDELNKTAYENTILNTYLAYENTKFFSSEMLIEEIINSENFFVNQKPGITLDKISKINNLSFSDINELFSNAGYKNNLVKYPDLSEYQNWYIGYSDTFKINYDGLFDYIEKFKLINDRNIWIKRAYLLWEFTKSNNNLKEIFDYSLTLRKKLNYTVSPEIFLIVEGITEEKLLPLFSSVYGFNFAENGIYLVSAGGKNQVFKIYKDYKNKLNIPIFVLLDSDAEAIANEINLIKRAIDTVYLIKEGEFEDILTYELIQKTINNSFSLFESVDISELRNESNMVNVLHFLWKSKGYGDFSKATFAKMVSDNIKSKSDVSCSIETIFNVLMTILNKENGGNKFRRG